MRVLHLINHSGGGGNVHVAVDLACEQQRRGDAAAYVSGGGRLSKVMERSGVRLFPLDQTRNRLMRMPEMIGRLCGVIDEFRPDVVHAHMMTGAVVGYMATRIKRVPLVTHIHNSFDRHSSLMRLGDRIIAVSTAVAQQAIQSGMRADKVRTVRNGTHGTARLSEAAPAPAALAGPAIGTLCGLIDRKGVDDVIRAFELVAGQHPGAHLYVIGSGPEREKLEAQAAATQVGGQIHFIGGVDDPRPMLAALDVFVLGSHADPCPLVIPEARWEGCAIVATNVDGIPEALENGAAGRLVPPRNPEAMAAEVIALLDDPARLAEARRASRAGAERYTVARMAHEIDSVYAELVKPAKQAAAVRSSQ